jgi:hypothetical protein
LFIEQSASLPGRTPVSSALFLRVRSRALRAASRARAAESAFSMIARPPGVLLEELGELLVDHALDGALDLAVAQLGLGLPLELRLLDLDRETQVSPSRTSSPESASSPPFLKRPALAGVVVDGAGQRGLEAGEVRAALVGVDVVDEGERVLVVAVVVLQRDLDLRLLAGGLDVDRLGCSGLRLPRRYSTKVLRPPS